MAGLRDTVWTIRVDLYRAAEANASLKAFVRTLLLSPGFEYIFWMRIAAHFNRTMLGKCTLGLAARFMLKRCSLRTGIQIPFQTVIGEGLYMGHFGCIVVHPYARVGRNCNISQDVTIGQTNRGPRRGYPVIGDNVYIGPGARVVGGVHVGNNVAIGANSVVTHDVPDNAVVVGIPGRVISHQGSADYVIYTDYARPPE